MRYRPLAISALLLLAACADPATPSVLPVPTSSTTTTTTTTPPSTTTLPPMTTTSTLPAAPTTTTVASAPTINGCQYAARIHEIFGPAGDWATAIAWRESRCTNVQNSEGASGVFQLMLPLHAQLFIDTCGAVNWADPDCNIRTAFALYASSGTAPWRL